MRRISTGTKVVDKFGAGKHGFTNGNPATGVPATDLEDQFFDHIQEELAAIVEANGGVVDGSARNQVLLAIKGILQAGAAKYAVDTGVANTYQVAYSPAITAVVDGMVLKFKAKTANTGASTFAPNGVAAAPIWGSDHAPLTGKEIIANGDVWVQWNASLNGGNGAWLLIDSTGGELPTVAGTKSNHAVNYGQTFGVGQTLQDVLASRVPGTTYTNSTGKPIFVQVVMTTTATSTSNIVATVKNFNILGSISNGAGIAASIAFVVMPGDTYSVTMNAGTPSINAWLETR